MKKSAWIDFFVCLFVGFYGVHKFREKKIGWGLLYLFTGGLFTLGWFYDCAVFLYVAIRISRTENVPEEERAPIDYVMAKKIGWIVVIVWVVLLFMAGACSPTPEAEDQGMGDSSIVDQIQTDEDKADSDVNSDVSFDDVIEDDTESNENETVLPEQSEEEKESDNIEEKEESSKEEPQKQEQQPQKQETPKQEATVETHTHSFVAATCIAAKSCSCGVIEGEPLGHEWKSATCTAPKTCKTCNATEGSKADHSWTDATCTAPQKCRTCSAEKGSAIGHNYSKGTCTTCGSKDPNYNEITYILNVKTKKFHRTTCWKLPVDNRSDSTLSRDEIVAQGYDPCGHCDP